MTPISLSAEQTIFDVGHLADLKLAASKMLGEEKHPDVANALWALAQSHSQQDPTFRTTLSFTRLTAQLRSSFSNSSNIL